MGKIPNNMFDGDSGSDVEIKTENEYAKRYDVWRKKEELNKYKTKYGEETLEESESSSSEDDEDGLELTKEVEKEFFKTLSYLKKKDPKIYDNKVQFFKSEEGNIRKEKKKKDEPMYIKDYERKLILENGGVVSDEENTDERPSSPTYVEEQHQIKQSLKKALDNINDDENDEWGGLLKAREKTKEEKEKEEEEYRIWLAGQKEEITDDTIKSELKPLKDFWTDPKLDDGEKFLRDYILKKKYLDNEQEDYIPTYDEIVHDSDSSLSGDEKMIEEQEEFEQKYNFRFEEPDQEFIKRYPRTIEKSLRKTDDRRKIKRAETKERKQKEKEEKMAELKKFQELKRKEIEEKIEKLKEISGNTDIGFEEEDIEGDFDPEAHDKRMQALFDNDFYEGAEEEQKPEFPEVDEELEIENWDRWEGETNDGLPHCEDENFIMDADYDPATSVAQELIDNTKGKKKRKRKSKVIEALNKPKPKYDPNDRNYEKYFDEYYKLECEDIIGDLPCRFKYREVIPNDFGLSVEEVLLAKDRELNKWCSLKKAVQHRPEHVEKYDQIAYSRKAKNIELKRKILPSLFSEEADEDNKQQSLNIGETKKLTDSTQKEKRADEDDTLTSEVKEEVSSVSEKPKNKTKKKKKKQNYTNTSDNVTDNTTEESSLVKKIKQEKVKNSTTHKKRKLNLKSNSNKKVKKFKKDVVEPVLTDARLSAYGINPKKFKNKLKYGKKN